MNLAILQARMSSARLPGKVLAPILGTPMLVRQIERIGRSSRIDELVIATSTEPEDDAIERVCIDHKFAVARGPLNDVLDRFHAIISARAPDLVIRLTADCPLADWSLIDDAIELCESHDYDYVANDLKPTFPHGLDVEVIRPDALEMAWREARLPSDREHVTTYIIRHPERFRLGGLEGPVDLSALRWTVDYPEDLALVRIIYSRLYDKNPAFTTADIVDLLRREPDLQRLNAGHKRNNGVESYQS